MARAADAVDLSDEIRKGGTDRGAALVTTRAVIARSVPVNRVGDDEHVRRDADGGRAGEVECVVCAATGIFTALISDK